MIGLPGFRHGLALRRLRAAVLVVLAALTMGAALAQDAPPVTVYTRARLTSTFEESDGRLYVRLKLVPNAKIPFATQTFRVRDRALVAPFSDGAWVKFTSRRIDGENVVTAMLASEECKRFQPCD